MKCDDALSENQPTFFCSTIQRSGIAAAVSKIFEDFSLSSWTSESSLKSQIKHEMLLMICFVQQQAK